MEQFVIREGRELRTGYTTGSCAAAASKAAALMLLTGEVHPEVTLTTPSGVMLTLSAEDIRREDDRVSCCIVKDGGDDPDVTTGLRIYSEVTRTESGFSVDGGQGVGRVTQPGLACSPGEAAINPVPRKMIAGALREAAQTCGYTGGLSARISVPGGEDTAKKTFNPRLGIVGGISILGTTGIVEPMSEKALVDTIRVEIDSKTAGGQKDLLICPGNYGRDYALSAYGFDLEAGVKCSNYIGEALDYAVYKKVERILLIGHAGKLVKLAGSIMNTHSRTADCRREIFAAHSALAGASREQVGMIMESVTTDEIDDLLMKWKLSDAVWESIMKKIMEALAHRTGEGCHAEVVVFTKNGARESAGAEEYRKRIREICQ